MYTISVWNNKSPNFNTNDFVRENGTDTFYAGTENEAILIAYKIGGANIIRLRIEDPEGKEIPSNIIFQKLLNMLFEEFGGCIPIPLD